LSAAHVLEEGDPAGIGEGNISKVEAQPTTATKYLLAGSSQFVNTAALYLALDPKRKYLARRLYD